jgi:hypothetical protein
MSDPSGLDVKSIQQIAGTLTDFGIYGFAAVSVVAFLTVKAKIAKILFGGVFAVGAGLSIFKMYIPPPIPPDSVRFVRGDFGLFEPTSLPKVLSLDRNFYVAPRDDGTYTAIDWVILYDKSVNDVALSLYVPYQKRTLSTNDLNPKIEATTKGGRFRLPLAPFGDSTHKQSDWVKLQIVPDKQSEYTLCLKGEPFKAPVCAERPQQQGSVDIPILPGHPTKMGGLLQILVSSAMAQTGGNARLDPAALRKALSSNDPQQLRDVTKVIQKDPVAYKDILNETFAKPVGADPSSDRLAIVTGLLDKYRFDRTVYPDRDTFVWIDDLTWRRIILDSFDRSDVLGELSRRFLRTAKSPRAKEILNSIIIEARAKLPNLDVCLDLLTQDIYVNWAILSFGSLKDAKHVTKENAKQLASLLTEIEFPNGGSLVAAHRLRANYMRAVILLQSAAVLGSPLGDALQSEGVEVMKQMYQQVSRLGAKEVDKVYYGNSAEIAKAKAFLESLTDTPGGNLELLERAQGDPRAYPSCKI